MAAILAGTTPYDAAMAHRFQEWALKIHSFKMLHMRMMRLNQYNQ